MQIKIKDTAFQILNREGTKASYRYAMGLLEGEWLEVETKHLFADQYNTARITSASTLDRLYKKFKAKYGTMYCTPYTEKHIKQGMVDMQLTGFRVMEELVADVEGDIREGAVRCHYCGEWGYWDKCTKCGSENVEDLYRVAKILRGKR